MGATPFYILRTHDCLYFVSPGSVVYNSEVSQSHQITMVHQERIILETSGHRHIQDITGPIAEIVSRSQIQSGTVNVSNIGSTGAIGTIEFEPGLQRDLPEVLDQLLPPSPDYGHEQTWHDGNGHSHLQATLLGPSLTIPVHLGSPVLGTWQQVFHLECDIKPRRREIVVTVLGQ